jgi:hypothetical protein
LIPNLRLSKLGIRHFVSVSTVLVSILSALATGGWAISSGANSLVTGGKSEIVPAFISSLSDTPSRPKTLVIGRVNEQLNYFITRGSDLEIGDPDVAITTPNELQKAITELISGVGISSSKLIGSYGIQYLYLRNPVDEAIARTIDGIGGFTRSSSTKSGVIWQVVGSYSRLSTMDATKAITGLNSTQVGGADELKAPGTVMLAEKFDTGWKLIVNSKDVELLRSPIGLPYFEVAEVGTLTLLHDGIRHRAFLSLQLISLLTVLVLSLPAGRRRREVPLEELS